MIALRACHTVTVLPIFLFLASSFGLATLANAQPSPAGKQSLKLAVCLPGVPLTSVEYRSRFVNDLAGALERGLGVPVRGRLYSKVADFERDIANISFALVDSAIAATARPQLRPLSIAVMGGQTSFQYALFAGHEATPGKFENKRLSYARMGRASHGIIHSLLFEGEDVASRMRYVPVPDVSSGLWLLKLGKVELLLAYAESLSVLKTQFPTIKILLRMARVPGVTFALGGARGAQSFVPRAQAVIAGFSSGSIGIQGFRPAAAGEFAALRRTLGSRPRKWPLFPRPTLRWRDLQVKLPLVTPPEPPLESYLALPQSAPPLLPVNE